MVTGRRPWEVCIVGVELSLHCRSVSSLGAVVLAALLLWAPRRAARPADLLRSTSLRARQIASRTIEQ